jgi:hypothetical protein
MYNEMHIEYIDPNQQLEPITVKYKIRNTGIAQRWASKVATCIDNHTIDDPNRFYGFDDYETEKQKAISAINHCCEVIDTYQPLVIRRICDPIDQDTLNYLHHIFEVYHGLLDQPHEFFVNAPSDVKHALAQLNIEVHRCESFVENSIRKVMPRHIVTWFGMDRHTELRDEDYQYFTDHYEYGTVYLLYVEIGKTLEDLAIDDDQYIAPEAFKPFRHYTADFVVRYFGTSTNTWRNNRLKLKNYYEKNKDFFDEQGLPLSHPYNRPGHIPLADLISGTNNIHLEIAKRQFVKTVKLV